VGAYFLSFSNGLGVIFALKLGDLWVLRVKVHFQGEFVDVFCLLIISKIMIFEKIHRKSFEIGGQFFGLDAKKKLWNLGPFSFFFLNDSDGHTFEMKSSRNPFIKRIKQIKLDLANSSFQYSLNLCVFFQIFRFSKL